MKEIYKKARNKYNSEIRNAKYEANWSFMQHSTNKCRAAWKVIKEPLHQRKEELTSISPNEFNCYFAEIPDQI